MNNSQSSQSQKPVELGEVADRVVADVLLAHEVGRDLGLQTGYRELDEVLGLRDDRLVILAGRPGMGKSLLAQSIGENAADHGFPAAYFSLEMSKRDLQVRALARETQIAPDQIRSGRLSSEERARVTAAVKRLEQRPFYIEAYNSLTLAGLVDRARELKRRHGVRVLIVDYVQLLLPKGYNAATRPNQLEAIARTLKLLARELNIQVIALAQISRSGPPPGAAGHSRPTERPTIADLEESIEDHADLVLLLHRHTDGAEERGTPELGPQSLLDLTVAYNRDGKPRGFRLALWERTLTIADP